MTIDSLSGSASKPHVLIVGGGFAGIHCAKDLARSDVNVTLVDRHNYHLFQPLLYQVASAVLSPADIASPIRRILRHQRNVKVVLAKLLDVDLENKQVFFPGAESIMIIWCWRPGRHIPILVATIGRQWLPG